MKLTPKQIESIRMALSEREKTLRELANNSVVESISVAWKNEIREELEGMPALRETMLQAWVDSFHNP